MSEPRKQIYLSAAERAAGTVVEIDDGEARVLVEVPAGARVGSVVRVRRGARTLAVEVCDRAWGLDGSARLDLAPRKGKLRGERAFWERAEEELVESRRADLEFAGAVYAEQRDDVLVLSGLHRRAVGAPGTVALDPSWGSLLWHTRPGLLSSLSAFSDADAKAARRVDRPLITVSHTALSPSMAANVLFPVGARSLMLVAGLRGLLALDRRRKGTPMLLGRALAARVVYPGGEVALVEHLNASLPRELFDRTAFAVDQRLGKAESRARRVLREVYEAAVLGRPPGA